MAIATGNYVMVNVDKGLALDVANATSTDGQNIQLNTRNDTDAQIVTVVNVPGSNTDQILRFPASWKCVDIAGGVMAHGTNVWQYKQNNSNAQKWRIVADGTRTYQGYQVYIVQAAANTGYVLASAANPGGTQVRTNVCIDKASTDGGGYKADRRWIFIPKPGLPNGVYRFIPSNTQTVSAGVTGKAGDAQIYMHANSDVNTQRWVVQNNGGNAYIVNKDSGHRATALSANTSSDIRLGDNSHGERQQWLIVQAGTGTYSGTKFPLVELRCVAAQSIGRRVWDAQGGVPTTKVNTKLICHDYNGGSNQKWVAVLESWLNSSIPAPSDCGVAYKKGETKYKNLWTRGKQNFVPTFKSTGKQFQMRYRTRVRKATDGDTAFGGWSAWKSISNNATTAEGYGIETSPNCAVTSSDGRFYAKEIPVTLSVAGNDCVEVQYQVREWRKQSASDIAHGNVATFTGRVKWQPQLTVTDIKWSPEGYKIYYSSDQKRNNNDFNVYKVVITDKNTKKAVTVFSGDYLINDVKHSGSMTIPTSKIPYIPNAGDTIAVTGRWTNVDGAYNKASETFTKTLAYDTGRDTNLFNSTIAVDSMKMLNANCNLTDGTDYQLFLDYNSDKTNFHKYTSSDGKWVIPPAFNKKFTVYVVARKGNKWDIESKAFAAITPRPKTFLFNYQKDNGDWGYFQLFADEGKSASITRTVQNDYDAQLVEGERREIVHFGYGHKEGGTVKGTHYKDSAKFPCGNIWPMDTGQSRYCWLRPANSEVYRVAITDFTITNERFDRTSYVVNYRLLDSISVS